MNFKISHILEGLKNTIFVKEEVEKIAQSRSEICNSCPKKSTNAYMNDPGPYLSSRRPDVYCTECACNLHMKVRSLNTSCPLNKWISVATDDEAVKIDNIINNINDKS